ncbi:MAG: Outer membrane lipoprotein BfpB [Pseudidiomarina mangrovi]|nr:MAG: Outer membrane lipoprotein BfpB [Pseudidiomarina mangrovi]
MRHLAQFSITSVSLLVISACSSSSESLQQDSDEAFQKLQQHWLLAATTNTSERVAYSEELYVPAIDPSHHQQPSWHSRPVEVALEQLSLAAVMQQTLAAHQVRVRYLDPQLAQQPIQLAYQGDLGGLLQHIQALYGWHVTIDEQQVSWSKFRTAEFDVAFIAGNTNFFMGNSDTQQGMTGNQSGQTSSQLSDMRSEQYLNFSSKELSVWDDLERALGLLLSEHGSMSINQSSSSVLVRDLPEQVAAVEHYLQQQNERLTRQVAIDVQIIEVTFNDTQQFAVDWQALMRTAGGEGVLGLSSNYLTTAGAVAGQLSWQQLSGKAQGSELFLQALAEQGLVQTNNQPRLLSLNNQIAKIVLEDNATYLAAAGSTSTANVGTSEMLQPGVVTTGFELYVLPSIRAGEVILQLSTELSDLQRIDEVRSGDQLIQTPHTTRKKFFMKALIADGETLLLSGLRNQREQRNQQQSWWSLALGGNDDNQQRRSETLVLLTPRIMARVKPS